MDIRLQSSSMKYREPKSLKLKKTYEPDTVKKQKTNISLVFVSNLEIIKYSGHD